MDWSVRGRFQAAGRRHTNAVDERSGPVGQRYAHTTGADTPSYPAVFHPPTRNSRLTFKDLHQVFAVTFHLNIYSGWQIESSDGPNFKRSVEVLVCFQWGLCLERLEGLFAVACTFRRPGSSLYRSHTKQYSSERHRPNQVFLHGCTKRCRNIPQFSSKLLFYTICFSLYLNYGIRRKYFFRAAASCSKFSLKKELV